MATLKHNRPQVQQGLADFFALKGQVDSSFDATILPVVNIADLAETPYSQYSVPVAEAATAPAVAAKLSYLMARPGQNNILGVRGVIIDNTSGAAASFGLRVMTTAQVNALTTAPALLTQFLALTGTLANPEAGDLRPSALNSGADALLLGNAFASLTIPNGDFRAITFPRIIWLYGTSQTRPAVAVVGSAVNTAVTATFFGEEWPSPG